MSAIDWHSNIAESFDSGYQRSARFAERLRVLGALIEQHLPDGGTFLDAGCGSGVFSLIAARRAAHVTGFDGSADMIALARAKPLPNVQAQVSFEVAELGEIAKFGPGEYDVVFSSSVLEYVEDLRNGLNAHAAMLRSGGVLIVSMPNGDSLYRLAERTVFEAIGRPRYLRYVRHMPRADELAQLVRRAGLQQLSTATFGAAPLLGPAMRALGMARKSDTLTVIAARRGGGLRLKYEPPSQGPGGGWCHINLHERYGGTLPKKLEFSQISARPRHPAQDARILEAYKKFEATMKAPCT